MTASEKMFLVLAEDLNFSRAAKKSFISQQALSDHIKRLEQHYGAALFIRTPSVMLTNAGKRVQRTLQMVQALEQNLQAELGEIQSGASGTIRLGINYTRAKLLIPPLFERYHTKYPNIKIELVLEETIIMQEMMKQGKLDGFLGVNGSYDAPLKAIPLSCENIYLIATGKYLRERLGWNPNLLTDRYTRVSLQDFDGLPFAMNHSKSTTYQLLEQYMEEKKIRLKNLLTVSDYQVLESVCRTGYLVSFCTQVYLPVIAQNNEMYPSDLHLYALPVEDLQKSIRFELIYNHMLTYPGYVTEFFEMLKESVAECLMAASSPILEESALMEKNSNSCMYQGFCWKNEMI